MKLFSCAAIALASTALIATLPASAQTESEVIVESETVVEVEEEMPMAAPEEEMPTTAPETSMPPGTTGISDEAALMSETNATPEAITGIAPGESITGITMETLPPLPPIMAKYFTLPITLQVPQDSSITSDTPITDSFPVGDNVAAWGDAISNCLKQQPKMVRVVDAEKMAGTTGTSDQQ